MLASHPFAKNANGWGTGLGSFPPIRKEREWMGHRAWELPTHSQKGANGWGTEVARPFDFPEARGEKHNEPPSIRNG